MLFYKCHFLLEPCAWDLLYRMNMHKFSFQKIEDKLLARETVVMENLKKELEEELEEGEVREDTAVIVVEESVRVKAEKTEVKENIFVKDEVLIEDTLHYGKVVTFGCKSNH